MRKLVPVLFLLVFAGCGTASVDTNMNVNDNLNVNSTVISVNTNAVEQLSPVENVNVASINVNSAVILNTNVNTVSNTNVNAVVGNLNANSTITTAKSYSLAEVQTHGDEASCWSAINGKVYDLGAWIKKHPGGEKNILRICGKDGSSAFNGEHGGDMKPEKILNGFEIGDLK